jgi:hypothetical protein
MDEENCFWRLLYLLDREIHFSNIANEAPFVSGNKDTCAGISASNIIEYTRWISKTLVNTYDFDDLFIH